MAPFRVSIWLASALSLSTLTIAAALPASAHVLISVDKSAQQMSVSVDGVPRYRFAVSTGRAGYGTPSGTYHPQRLAASWFRQCLTRYSFTAGMPFTAATRSTGLADLPHMVASACTPPMPQPCSN
jgi:hypothetical protein